MDFLECSKGSIGMEWEHPFGMGDHEPCGPSSYALLTNHWNLAFSLSLSFFIQQMILLAAMRTAWNNMSDFGY